MPAETWLVTARVVFRVARGAFRTGTILRRPLTAAIFDRLNRRQKLPTGKPPHHKHTSVCLRNNFQHGING